MGLSIHYKGSIRAYALIDSLVEEAQDICESLNWKYVLINDDDLKGICISPKESEPLMLTFKTNGRLCSPVSIITSDETDPYFYTANTKTQFAGRDTHIAVIKLLKYLSGKYFESIEVSDEGYYWETGDENLLDAQFKNYNLAFDTIINALQGLEAIPGESADSLADRMEDFLRKKLGGGEDLPK